MASCQDHKPVFDGDQGLNTGGMGAYSPAPVVTDEVNEKIIEKVLRPIIYGMGEDILRAIERTYQAVKKISWDGVHYRTDIGQKALCWR